VRRKRDDPFVTRQDCIAMLRGVRNGLLIVAPGWIAFIWWLTK